jgi:hypothetical protein
MKRIFSILLLLTMVIYILPVKQSIVDSIGITMSDIDDEKNETDKKTIVILSYNDIVPVNPCASCSASKYHFGNLHALLHLVETPPPDFC